MWLKSVFFVDAIVVCNLHTLSHTHIFKCSKRKMRQRPTSFVKFIGCMRNSFTTAHSLNEKLSREWNEEREMRESKKKVCNLCKNKSHKMIWGVFGSGSGSFWVCTLHTHDAYTHNQPFDTHSFHIHLFVFAATSVCRTRGAQLDGGFRNSHQDHKYKQ